MTLHTPKILKQREAILRTRDGIGFGLAGSRGVYAPF